MLKTLIQSQRLLGDFNFTSPRDFLAKLNKEILLLLTASPDTIIAFSALFIDPAKKQIKLSNAGLPPVLIAYSSGAFEYFFQDGSALGFSPDSSYIEHQLSMQKGDSIALMTDGITEYKNAASVNNELYMQLANIIAAGTPIQTLMDYLQNKQEAKQFKDDATLMLIHF